MKQRIVNLVARHYHYVVILPALAFGLMIHCTPLHAADFALYGCKSDMGSKMAEEMAGGDAATAASLAAAAPVNVFRFDFVNKRVTYRMLDNKGKEYGLFNVGKRSRYTVPTKIDGDEITWTDVPMESPQGTILENNTFNRKTGKLHVETVMKPSNGKPPESIGEDMTCTPYSFKHNKK